MYWFSQAELLITISLAGLSLQSNWKTTCTWAAVNFKKTCDLNELYTWADNKVMKYQSADSLFWQVSTEHNVDTQY